MDIDGFLSATGLSGVVYDIMKTSATLTLDNLKQKLKGWIIDEVTAQQLVNNINEIPQVDELNERALTKKFEQNETLMELLQTIKVDQSVKQVIQNHSGSGDNVAGDKHVTYESGK